MYQQQTGIYQSTKNIKYLGNKSSKKAFVRHPHTHVGKGIETLPRAFKEVLKKCSVYHVHRWEDAV